MTGPEDPPSDPLKGHTPMNSDELHHVTLELLQVALQAPDLDTALLPVLGALVQHTAAVGAGYFQWSDEALAHALRCWVGQCPLQGCQTPFLRDIPAHLPLLEALRREAGPLDFVDTLGDPVVGQLGDLGVRALFAAPVQDAGGALVGVLVAYSPAPHGWTAQERLVIGGVSGLVTVLTARLQLRDRELAAHEGALRALGLSLEARDAEAQGHIDRVTRLAERLGMRLGLRDAELRDLRWGAYLHDLGKIGLPDEILLCDGPLTSDMRQRMQGHVREGVRLAGQLPFVRQTVLDVIGAHHERWDGGGYPAGLRREAIPLPARIFSACDVFDALISARRYKPAWAPEEALGYIRQASGEHFDPQVVTALIDVLAERPEELGRTELQG